LVQEEEARVGRLDEGLLGEAVILCVHQETPAGADARAAVTRRSPKNDETSRISTTRPSPRMVAPATPKALPDTTESSALITTCCWPRRRSTVRPTRFSPRPTTTT